MNRTPNQQRPLSPAACLAALITGAFLTACSGSDSGGDAENGGVDPAGEARALVWGADAWGEAPFDARTDA